LFAINRIKFEPFEFFDAFNLAFLVFTPITHLSESKCQQLITG
jgi:hypothetical protein